MPNLIRNTPKKELTHLIKPTGVIHIEHKISLLGQKLFNVLLAHAFPTLQETKIHTIPVKELLKHIPSAKNVAHLRKTLKEMCIPVEFNIFDKDKEDWGFFALLPQAYIKPGTGICEYAFTPKMVELMSDTSKMMYAKLTLLIQQEYRASKYGWFLYELCFDYKDVPGGGKTKKLPLNLLRQFLGVKPHQYLKYRSLNQHVLKKALSDVNKRTELNITSEEYKEGRKVTHIQYFINLKKNEPVNISSEDGKTDYSSTLKLLGISDKIIKSSMVDYSIEQIEKALLVYKEEEQSKGVKHPTAFFEESLKEGWNPKPQSEESADKEAEARQQAEDKAADLKLYQGSTNEERFEELYKRQPAPFKRGYKELSEKDQKLFREKFDVLFAEHDNFDDIQPEWAKLLLSN